MKVLYIQCCGKWQIHPSKCLQSVDSYCRGAAFIDWPHIDFIELKRSLFFCKITKNKISTNASIFGLSEF